VLCWRLRLAPMTGVHAGHVAHLRDHSPVIVHGRSFHFSRREVWLVAPLIVESRNLSLSRSRAERRSYQIKRERGQKIQFPMPPRRQTRRTDGEGAAGGSPAALASLPPDVLEMVAERIVTQDTLNNPVTAAQDIASLAQTCRCGLPAARHPTQHSNKRCAPLCPGR
jgi:hypothetical protein